MEERKRFLLILTVFLGAYYIPFQEPRIQGSIIESFLMLQEYAREHVLLCLVPAFFIAGAIANFLSQGAVIKYFGSQAKKWVAYSVASVSGIILAVCSCTVLPLFAGIYRKGAGIGPAIAFLYAGPAINLLAIILTARVLGWQLGIARAVGAVIFSIIIGLTMAVLFRDKDGTETTASQIMEEEDDGRSPMQNGVYFLVLVLILVFAAWGRPSQPVGFFNFIYEIKWFLVVPLLLFMGYIVKNWFHSEERVAWVDTTWDFSKQILPLLFIGVLIAGFLMGRPQSEAGLIPSNVISALVGGNSLQANLLAALAGAFMYFATLTEVPILQGLLGSGMGQGPALALLLAGPAVSLPNILVIRSIIGTRKTIAFVVLVVALSTLAGLVYGNLFF